ncbi:hypothetical protein, partial [Streptomyces sp. ID05-47C]|uniref:hypothetical protein n=1 Tax=Streptomyces sp. ID05-47C TaxID=3028665 RepID=UPI0029A3B1ED
MSTWYSPSEPFGTTPSQPFATSQAHSSAYWSRSVSYQNPRANKTGKTPISLFRLKKKTQKKKQQK